MTEGPALKERRGQVWAEGACVGFPGLKARGGGALSYRRSKAETTGGTRISVGCRDAGERGGRSTGGDHRKRGTATEPRVPTPRGRPLLAPCRPPRARARAPRPYLSSLAVITPSSLGMSSAAVTASWWPSILLSSTGRLLCGLEWISAAMFAPRPPPRAAHQLTAGRGRAGCLGQPGRVCATLL